MSKRQYKIKHEIKKEIQRREPSCKSEREKRQMINQVRHEANEKYGHDWRWTEREY